MSSTCPIVFILVVRSACLLCVWSGCIQPVSILPLWILGLLRVSTTHQGRYGGQKLVQELILIWLLIIIPLNKTHVWLFRFLSVWNVDWTQHQSERIQLGKIQSSPYRKQGDMYCYCTCGSTDTHTHRLIPTFMHLYTHQRTHTRSMASSTHTRIYRCLPRNT